MSDQEPAVEVFSGELPDFEGVIPTGVVTKVTGAGQRIHRPMHLGERGTLVVEYEVTNVAHERTDDGVKRKHTLKALDLFELPGRPGKRLLNTLRENYRLANPEQQLPLDPLSEDGAVDAVVGTTDGSGVLMTPADMEELGLGDASRDPVMVILDDGTRALWPDDWGKHAPDGQPAAGDYVWPPGAKPGDDEQLVREVLDPMSGDQLGEWTDEDEDARLLQEERAAEAAEEAEADESDDLDLIDEPTR